MRILGGGKAGPNIAPRKVEVRDIHAGIVPLNPPAELKPRERVKLCNPKRAGTQALAAGARQSCETRSGGL